jgi:hypothetical protein
MKLFISSLQLYSLNKYNSLNTINLKQSILNFIKKIVNKETEEEEFNRFI